MRRIACRLLEINHAVCNATGPDPLVVSQANRITLRRIILRSFKRQQCRSKDLDAMFMRSADNLRGCKNQVIHGGLLFRPFELERPANVIGPFKEDEILHAALRQDIAVEPPQGTLSAVVAQHLVAIDALIQDRKG